MKVLDLILTSLIIFCGSVFLPYTCDKSHIFIAIKINLISGVMMSVNILVNA